MSNAGVSGSPLPDRNPIDGLLVALSQTFSLIALGYVLGVLGVVDVNANKGYNAFLSWVALPAILFSSMSTLDFAGVDWTILLVMVLSKAILMVLTMVITYVFSPRNSAGQQDHRLLKCAMFGLFTTLTNDVGVGLPIVEELYPQYTVYLLFPIQSLIFNPLSLVLLEYGHSVDSPAVITSGRMSSVDVSAIADKAATPVRPLYQRILRSIFANQLVLCVLLGLLYNLLFDGHLPTGVRHVLSNAGNAFSALAAFNIGLSMVGKTGKLKGRRFTWPFVLASLKVIASGIITQKLALFLMPNNTQFQEFAFMYGALPVASVCCVFASNYDACPTVIAGGLVISMILSPIAIFIGLGFILVSEAHDLDHHYGTTALYLDGASIVGSLWLLALRIWCPGFRKWPQTLIAHFAFTSLLFASLHLSCLLVGRSCIDLHQYVCSDELMVAYQAVMYGRFFVNLQLQSWPVLMVLNLVLWSRWSESKAREAYPYILLSGWAFPSIWTAVAWALNGGDRYHFDVGCIFAHGALESTIMALAYTVLLVIGVWCMVLLNSRKLPDNFSSPNAEERISITQRDSEIVPKVHDKFRTLVLLTVDLLGLLLSIVRLFDSIFEQHEAALFFEPAGIELVTSVLAVVLVNSLGLVGCLIFAFHKEARALYNGIALSLQSAYCALVYNASDYAVYYNEPNSQVLAALGEATVDNLVDQLLNNPLLGNRRYRLKWYVGCATGHDIATWFVKEGWADDRAQAVLLGQQLLRVGVLYHVHLEHDFEDNGLFYRVRPRA